jgi:hypothetical protein
MPQYDFRAPSMRNAIEEVFVRRAMEERQRLEDEFRRRQAEEQSQRQASELGLRQQQEQRITQETARQAERQAAMDAEAAETRRMATSQQQNQMGVRTMMADAMSEPLTPERAQQISVMGFREGMPVPAIVDQAMQPQPAPAPFTLGEGQIRFGPDGQVIATGQARPTVSDNEPLMAVIGDDGQPVLMPRSQASGRRPASTREQGRPVTSSDAGRVADIDTSLNDLTALRSTLTETSGATGTAASIGAAMPNFVTDITGVGTTAKQRQGVIDRVKQVIGKTMEGGVLRKEDESKYARILPTISDPPDVALSKLDGLEQALKQRRQTFLDSLRDANYDVGKFDAPRAPRRIGRFEIVE